MELVDLALDVVNETESQDVKTQDELFTEYKNTYQEITNEVLDKTS
ncbi:MULTISPECIES: hypothetical protein [Staphylococcus]|jgi:hypothetical protein|nr:hypothetical protein [Staphylococcus hominis]MCC3712388.1 hypothetical protein [Staphylococcus hominis]MCC3714522.1 hypothetical protein [Staphylococcus hominis]MCC3738233.1 hypothetical protein [Staphylococcus hominis]HDP6314755.1 hypothetical protein [Staphylococcus aureus]